MKTTLPILAILLLTAGCSSNGKKEAPHDADSAPVPWEHYTCEWFEFDYPGYLQVDKERNEISDTIPGLKDGGDVRVHSDYLPYSFKFTKSCMMDVFDDPEDWRDFSIETKLGGLSEDSGNYVGIYGQKDSIDFKGHRAASVTFAVLEDGDTIIHHQLVVMSKPTKDLYYLNLMAPKDFFDTHDAIIDSVFNSITLK